ncbi:hypothetical protein BX666DRAFT_1960563 [Dichotomocladium elegans]|nr:hypothetical protein BX666DRAFT_1960563 [Dichotomocladium elegans]
MSSMDPYYGAHDPDSSLPSQNFFEQSPNPDRYPEDSRFLLTRSRYSFLLVVIAAFEAIVVIALEAAIFVLFLKNNADRDLGQGIPVYLMIFIVCQLYQIAIAWDAVRMQNTIQVIAFFLLNLCCFMYGSFQFQQISAALAGTPALAGLKVLIDRLLVANVVVIGLCEALYVYIGILLYKEFGWQIYEKIGADPTIRNMYLWYQILLTILKVDMFFFLGYSIQYLVLVLQSGDVEFPLTVIALPLTCLFLILAVYAVRHESKPLAMIFFLGSAAGCAYFIFKIARIFDPTQADKYRNIKNFLTFFASVSLALLLLTVANIAICWSNFNRGLKAHLLRDRGGYSASQLTGDRILSLD